MEITIRDYDFKKPQRYSSDNMRFLSLIAEDFCKYMNLNIAYDLKQKSINAKLKKVRQTNFEEFMKSIEYDSIIIEHDILPLVKGLIYQMDKTVALTLIDLMLGGDGSFKNKNRELTEIDKHLILNIAETFIKRLHIVEGCNKREVSNIYTNIESSNKFSVSESVLITQMTMYNGTEEIGKMHFCNPYCCMEPVLEQLETKKLLKTRDIEGQYEFTNAIYQNICSVKADMTATLGNTNISVRDLINLNVGDVLKLDNKANGVALLSVNGYNVYECKPGLIKNKKGLIIVDTIDKQQP
ncbi:flagellar motor switch protein FliM [Paraclostridium bifermentans]|uniref:flagellar motor switch protein FliM n=1 Tax=Paraclostridium bifermentans TaxID=1490 RepID=UPI0025B17D0F|nr:FliM/FliN family flagellar motor switch protein [Paraclostridium bifermentans]